GTGGGECLTPEARAIGSPGPNLVLARSSPHLLVCGTSSYWTFPTDQFGGRLRSMSPHSRFSPGPRTRVRRKDRALSLPEAAIAVIDEALICHLAFVLAPAGSSGRDADASSAPTLSDEPAQCLPMAHARIGETIYVHGACSNQMLRSLVGRPCSLTFTLLDGLVFARSAFHHSMNYRCAVAVGAARLVEDETEKRQALHALVEHTAP